MEILDHTDEHQPTLMRDVYEAFVGQKVVIYTSGSGPFTGRLSAYNGYIVKLTSETGHGIYLPMEKIVALAGENNE